MKIKIIFKDRKKGIKIFDPVINVDFTCFRNSLCITYRVYIGEFQDYHDEYKYIKINDIARVVIE